MVKEEILRLEMRWDCEEKVPGNDLLDELLGKNRLATLDRFDRVQLADVITVCRKSRSLSEAGRELFTMSRKDKQISNDADRLWSPPDGYAAASHFNREFKQRTGTTPSNFRKESSEFEQQPQ